MNETTLPYYLPPEVIRHEDEQSFFFAIARLFPERIEDLATNIYPIYEEAIRRYDLDSNDTEKLQETRASLKSWQSRNNLEYGWVTKRLYEILQNWHNAEQTGFPLYQQRMVFIFGVPYGPPGFLGDLTTYTFTYTFKHGFNRGKVQAEITKKFEKERKAYLDAVQSAYKKNGWKLGKKSPQRQRNIEIAVLNTVGELTASKISQRLDLEFETEPLRDVEKALSTMKRKLRLK